MSTYDDLSEARNMFGIAEAETMGEVKRKVNILLKQWHPDTGPDGSGERNKKTTALLQAREIIMHYCDAYKISFSEREVNKYLSPREKWLQRFGDDHIWGGGAEK
jgi:hypothetical protein